MNFAHPWWLLAGAVACGALIWTWRMVDGRQRRALEQFIAPQLREQLTQSMSGARTMMKRALYAAAVVLLFVALAGPQAGFRWEQVTRRGNDIIFAVDTSRSMLTPDVKPDRLTRAKLAIDDFVSHLNGDAVGLVAFAGSAFLQSPITLDYGAFHESLAALDTHIIPRGGTDITSAIHEAQAALKGRAGSDKILILVTDGEDLEGDSLSAAKAAAKQDGLKIFTVGVGSANGDLIPLPADQGGGFLKDSTGQLVKSRLDESALKSLAAATGGIYAPLGSANQGLDTIYQAALAPLAKHELSSKAQKVYSQRFQWPLGASLALLMASLLIGTRRRAASATPATPRGAPPPRVTSKRSWERYALPAVAGACAIGAFCPINAAHASAASAAAAYAHGDYAKAAQDYSAAVKKNPTQPTLQFDAGTAAYRAGDFSQAAQAFKASVDAEKSGNAKRLAEQEDAYYNLGNTLYREGQKTEKADTAETIKTWTQAVKVYDAALQLRADDSDTKFNRDLVNRKIEDLKNQQKEQSKQDQSKQDQSKQDQSKKDQSTQPSKAQNSSKPEPGQGKPQQGEGQPSKDNQQEASNQGSTQGQGSQNKPQPNGSPSQPAGAQDKTTQQAAQGSQPSPGNGSEPRADRAPGAGGDQVAQASEDQRQPGGMSQQEARELLDSVKGEEKHAPGAPVARNSDNASMPEEPLKDW
jgi:Ca-activated chloride channel family protein